MRARVDYAVRTLAGPWLVLAVLGLDVATFFMRGMPWRGEGLWTVEWFALPLFIIGPLCAGVAAVDAARLSRPGNVHLVLSVPRPARVYLRAAAWCAGPAVGAHLAVVAVALAVGQVRQPSVGWLALLAGAGVQAAAIVWFTAVGSAVGRYAPPLAAGLAAGVLGFTLHYVAGKAFLAEPSFRLLDLGGASITMLGKAYHGGYVAGQLLLFGLTAAVLLALPLRSRRGVNAPSALGALAVVAVVGVIAASPAVMPAQREIDAPRPPELCVGTAPQVCLYAEHRRFAGLVVPRVQRLVAAARDNGYAAFVPERVLERSRSFRPGGPGTRSVWLPSWAYEDHQITSYDLVLDLVTPNHCDAIRGGPQAPPMQFQVRLFSLLATWLHLAGEDVGHAPIEYRILAPAEVAAIMDDFARCDLAGGR